MKKNNRLEGLQSKKILWLIVILTLVSAVTALEIDNIKDYEPTTQTMTYKNSFLGFATTDIAKVTLLTPKDNLVIRGSNRIVAEFEIETYEDYTNFLKQFQFYNLKKSGIQEGRSFKIKYATYTYTQEPNYIEKCSDKIIKENKTTVCSQEIKDYREVQHIEWKDLDLEKTLPKGRIRIALVTDVLNGDYIEATPTFFGVRSPEYLTFADGLGAGLTDYWGFNEGSGTTAGNNVTAAHAGTLLDGAGWNSTTNCKIGSCAYVSLNDQKINFTRIETLEGITASYTMNFWMYYYTQSSAVGRFIAYNNDTALDGKQEIYIYGNPITFNIGSQNGAEQISSGVAFPNTNWTMFTFWKNTTHFKIYINSVDSYTGAYTGSTFSPAHYLIFNIHDTGDVAAKYDEFGIWNRTLSASEISDLYNFSTGLGWTPTIVINSSIILNTPADSYSTSSNTITFNCSGGHQDGLLNLTLQIDGIGNYTVTNSSAKQNLSLQTSLNVNEGSHVWNCMGVQTDLTNKSGTERSFIVDKTPPTITFSSPSGTYNYMENSTGVYLNWTVEDNIQLGNCWYNYNSINYSINCSTNTTTFFPLFDKKNITLYVNDSANNVNLSTVSWNYLIFSNYNIYNSSSYETTTENYLQNITYNNSIYTSISANLIYNGTTYSTVKTTGDHTLFSKTLDTKSMNGSLNFYYAYTLTNSTGSYNINSVNKTVNVYSIQFALCNSSLTNKYVNYTFINEYNSSYTTSTMNANFKYYAGSGSVNKTYLYQNTTENSNYVFCFSNVNLPVKIIPSIVYANSESPSRSYYLSSAQILTNSTTNTPLYLLPTTYGIYSSFQVITASLQGIPDAFINFSVNSNGYPAEAKYTDSSGVAAFFLNPTTLYNIQVTKAGYTTYSTTITPSQTQYTISMEGSITTNNATNYFNGITYDIKPNLAYLYNDTTYNFNITISSSYWALDSWGFNLTSSNGSLLADVSSTDTVGGFLSADSSTSNNTGIKLVLYWVVGGNKSSITKYYVVENTLYSGWSIYNGILDLKTYLASGFFGLDYFGLNLIVFALIFIITGIICFKFGLYSPATVAGVLFLFTAIADVGLGLIYYDPTIFVSKVPHVATVLIGITTAALGIKEVTGY